MGNSPLWKYCTREQCQDFILSLRLIPGGEKMSRKKQLSCLYTLSNRGSRNYRRVTIDKKDGGSRTLLVPCGLLKGVQRNILHHVLDERPVSSCAQAYRKGTDIRGNASCHLGKKLVLKLDISHFFDSILFPRVYGAAFPETLFPPAAAMLLTSLCCCNERLPQGSPASPAISNLVMRPFDIYMDGWCRERGIAYTRYCDDMTFSGDFDAAALCSKVRSYLEAMGFTLNEKKTKLLTGDVRQSVTGIVVNDKLQVSREYRKKLRQEVYYCKKYGIDAHLERVEADTGIRWEKERYICSVQGRLRFVLQVNPQDAEFAGYCREWKELFM